MEWQLDPDHSSLTVSAKHMMLTTVRGTLDIASATLAFDPEHPEQSRVEAVIDAASIDTGVEQRDAHLRSPDFLDVANHPHITFRSTRIEREGDRFRIHGDLTIRGVTRPVSLDARIVGVVKDRHGGRRAAFSAETTINREDWGLTWNMALEQGGWLVSKDLKVEIELAALEPAEQQGEQTKERETAASAA
ncbi:MAG TPA: YceI family protein [candidate division Zixibacteria bacterium]|nr:YceI family protein [candidate division Zixibacteria bacterium]